MDKPDLNAALKALVDQGLSFSDCVKAFGAPEGDPFAAAAEEMYVIEGSIEIDATTVLSQSAAGAYVMAWVWVDNSDAGILSNSELLEEVYENARRAADGGVSLPSEEMMLLAAQCDWLEDLISNFADELDSIAEEKAEGAPGPVNWQGLDGKSHRFMASSAITSLSLRGRDQGLSDQHYDSVCQFIRDHGNKLDAMLNVLEVAAA